MIPDVCEKSEVNSMRSERLLKFDGIVTQCHDGPDAIASGFTL